MRRAAAPALIGLAALAPLVLGTRWAALGDLTVAAAYVVMALGLNVVVGYAGLLDLGYVAFVAIGAYTAAYVASGYWGIHVDFLVVLVLAVAATTLAGVVIGLPTLRLRGDYVAIVTLAFGEIIGRVAANGDDVHVFGGTLTAGPNNIGPLDRIDLPLLKPFSAVDPRPWYWFALGLVALALLVNVRLRGSRIGRAWTALRDDERAAAAAGVPIARTKLVAYATGGAFGGVAGAFIASYFSAVNAGQFEFSLSLFVLSMVVLGGLGSLRGVVAGAIVLSLLNTYLLPDVLYSVPRKLGLAFDFPAIASGVYGAIVLVVVLLRPQGLLPPDRTPTWTR